MISIVLLLRFVLWPRIYMVWLFSRDFSFFSFVKFKQDVSWYRFLSGFFPIEFAQLLKSVCLYFLSVSRNFQLLFLHIHCYLPHTAKRPETQTTAYMFSPSRLSGPFFSSEQGSLERDNSFISPPKSFVTVSQGPRPCPQTPSSVVLSGAARIMSCWENT